MSGALTISAQVLGADLVEKRFSGDAAEAAGKMKSAVQRLGLEVLRRAKEKLSDDVLHVQTGRGRRSMNEETTVEGTSVTSTVGTPLVYLGFWERGFQGVEQVREHERRIPGAAKGSKAMAIVRAHSRQVNEAPRSFLVSSLNELRPRIAEQLAQAVL